MRNFIDLDIVKKKLTNTETALFDYIHAVIWAQTRIHSLPLTKKKNKNKNFNRTYMFLLARLGNITRKIFYREKNIDSSSLALTQTTTTTTVKCACLRLNSYSFTEVVPYFRDGQMMELFARELWWWFALESKYSRNSFNVSRLRMRKWQFSSLESIHFLDSLRKQQKGAIICFFIFIGTQ